MVKNKSRSNKHTRHQYKKWLLVTCGIVAVALIAAIIWFIVWSFTGNGATEPRTDQDNTVYFTHLTSITEGYNTQQTKVFASLIAIPIVNKVCFIQPPHFFTNSHLFCEIYAMAQLPLNLTSQEATSLVDQLKGIIAREPSLSLANPQELGNNTLLWAVNDSSSYQGSGNLCNITLSYIPDSNSEDSLTYKLICGDYAKAVPPGFTYSKVPIN